MKAKEYTNGEITIVWKPDICIHSGICVKTLPHVYKPNERPWIQMEHATSQEMIDINEAVVGRIVERCNGFFFEIEKEPGKNYRLN